jgi:hypothetical protein
MDRRRFLWMSSIVPAVLRGQGDEPGSVPLFDGKTLNGWSVRDGPESAFYVENGDIVGHESSDFPAWLRSDRQYENFDFRCEFFVRGWSDGGVYLHAPEHGRNTWIGMKIKIFHQADKEPKPESCGSVFPLVAPLKVPVRKEWNSVRMLMDWPTLRVWINEEAVQDLDVERVPELRHRLRCGYLGLETLSYPIRFRNLRIRALPSTERWETLYEGPEDFSKWVVSDGKPNVKAVGKVLWANGSGQFATREKYKDFELQLYIRGEKHHNGGVCFRAGAPSLAGGHYEIQVHDVEEAHYPTGSLYHYKRASYPRIEAEKWYLMQLVVQGSHCLVRVNGETVLEYDKLEHLEPGPIELQAHQPGRWLEYKQVRVKRLPAG